MTMNSYSARLWFRWIVYPRSCVSANSRTARSSSGDEVSVSPAAGKHRDAAVSFAVPGC